MKARPDDIVQKITCRCGSQLVARWAVPTWSCGTCGQAGEREERYRLLDVSVSDLSKRRGGWEVA